MINVEGSKDLFEIIKGNMISLTGDPGLRIGTGRPCLMNLSGLERESSGLFLQIQVHGI